MQLPNDRPAVKAGALPIQAPDSGGKRHILLQRTGIAAGMHDLINVVTSDGPNEEHPMISSGRSAQDVVEVLSGFITSVQNGNMPVQMAWTQQGAAAEVPVEAEAARL